MAEPMTIRLLDVLLAELQRITIANGFATDLGLWMSRERVEVGIPTAPRGTVALLGKRAADNNAQRPLRGRAVDGVIEIVLPTTYGNALDTIYRADDDVERALFEMGERLNAGEITAYGGLVPIYVETAFLDRPEGLPMCGAEITWTAGWRTP